MTRQARLAPLVAGLLLLLLAALAWWLLRPAPPPRLTLQWASFAELSGWREDAVAAALPALRRSCHAILAKPDDAPLDAKTASADFGPVRDWRESCEAVAALPADDETALRAFIEREFVPLLAGNNGDSRGLFTGYFEMTLHGARKRGGPYQTPLYRRPPEPARTAHSRAEIEDGA
ncbi:MAG: MltA domain-containing protein, partial [Thiohalocapsa sp.]